VSDDKSIRTDVLGDRLAAGHLLAQKILGDNKNAKTVKQLKFPRGTPADVKKLVQYYKFVKYMKNCKDGYNYIREAFQLYSVYPYQSSPKWQLEALILGGCPNKRIMDLIGIHEKTVSFYKRFYFDLGKLGTMQMLRAQAGLKLRSYIQRDIPDWCYKLDVLINGAEWFIRTYILMQPNEEDIKLGEKTLSIAIKTLRMGNRLLVGNEDNWARPSFINMIDRIGPTISQIQTEEINEVRISQGTKSADVNEKYSRLLTETCLEYKITIADSKESAFGEEKSEEELLPI